MYCWVILCLFVLPLSAEEVSFREGYALFPNLGYYRFYPDWGDTKGLTWIQAQQACEKDQGHLPIINSHAEFDLLYGIFEKEIVIPAFSPLGFHDLFLDGNFVTLYGDDLSATGYTVWGEPCTDTQKCGNSTSGHCGVMSRFSPGLYVQPCDQLYGFFCEKELWHDYEYYSKIGYYKLHKEGKTWGEAWSSCRAEGAELAVINSKNEYTTLQEILTRNPTFTAADTDSAVHLGFHNKYQNELFITIDGSYLNTAGYFLWADNEPATSKGTCGGLLRDSNLFIGNCSAKLAFICEHSV